MTYAYNEGVVWLEDLAAEAHPMIHDLCDLHAETVRVPIGWEFRDQRAGRSGQAELDLIGA